MRSTALWVEPMLWVMYPVNCGASREPKPTFGDSVCTSHAPHATAFALCFSSLGVIGQRMIDDDPKPLSPTAAAFAERWKRRVKFAQGSTAERGFRRAFLDRDVAEKDPKCRSEKSRAEWRNDPRRDEKIYSYINRSLRSGQPVRLTVNAKDIVSLSRKTVADATRSGVKAVPDVFVPHWDHSSRLLKMLGWGLASRELKATPFSLRIAPEVFHVARADKVGAARYLQDRLSRQLRNRLPGTAHAFWFAIECGPGDEPHLHGAVVIPDDQREQVRNALVATGGRWKSSARQLDFGRPKNLVTWVGYSTKWLFGSMLNLQDDNLIAASQPMRREAKRMFQQARSERKILYL